MTSHPPEPPDDRPTGDAAPPPSPPPTYGQPSYGYAPPPDAAMTPGGARPGELLDRFLARLIDHVLLGVVGFVIGAVIVVGAIMGESGGTLGMGTSYAASAILAVINTAIALGYFGYLESSRGQTVGKMIINLKTVGPDGGNPTMEQALRRNGYVAIGLLGLVPVLGLIGPIISLVAVILIAVGINKDSVSRQAWHDHFAGGTRVLKIG